MTAAWNRYENFPLFQRLFLITAAAVLFNGIYCLAYRYAAGNPTTVGHAIGWGTINLAPWIAAVEIGRHQSRLAILAGLVAGAGALSIALGAVIGWHLPDSFDLVRRIPGAIVAVFALMAFAVLDKLKAREPVGGEARLHALPTVNECRWVRSAGNYVEVHTSENGALLVRSSLAQCVSLAHLRLVRIHRSYAVSRDSIAQVERTHVKLIDGTRLPIGDRFRDRLNLLD